MDHAQETAGRDDYYDAALVNIVLFCDGCKDYLDPDEHLGPGEGFHSQGYYVLLGDEAFRRGWLIERNELNDFTIFCPVCRRARGGVAEEGLSHG